jgi:hypothetical protein
MGINRKAFNFYKSYYEVAKELSEKDRSAFLWALIEKQFLGVEPKLNGMAKFAYISQQHSINQQVSGWEIKTGLPLATPTEPPCQPPTVQEQEEVQGQEEEQGKVEQAIIQFSYFWDMYDKKVGDKSGLEKKWAKLTYQEKQEIMIYLPKYKISQPDKQFRKNPDTFLNQRGWEHELVGYKETITHNTKGTIKDNNF